MAMMGRNHVITGGLALGWVAASGVASGIAVRPAGWVLAAGLFAWGTLAPDLDSEDAIASSTWAPRDRRAGGRQERLLPSARSVVGTITPGSHWLSGVMRLLARRHYHATRGPGDAPSNDDPHRKLWHTATGAIIMAAAVCALISPAPWWLVTQQWPWLDAWRTPDGRAWPAWVTAAVPIGLMWGVAFRGYFGEHIGRGGKRRRGAKQSTSRSWGFLAGAATTVVCGATGTLDAAWPMWGVAVVAGCAVHVAGDGCSRAGVSWWAPYRVDAEQRRWGTQHLTPPSWRFRTGYGGESFFVLGLIVVSLAGWWALLAARGLVVWPWELADWWAIRSGRTSG